MTAAPISDQRLGGLDSLKGIAIVLVVAIHAAPSDARAYTEHFVNGVARLAVPLFVAITGFLVGARQPTRAKLVGYFWTFLRLHVLYGAFYWLVEPLRGMTWAPLTLANVLAHFAAFSYAGQFYLCVLPQIYFVFAFLVPDRLRSSRGVRLGAFLMMAATLGFAAWAFESGTPHSFAWLLAGHADASVSLWLFPFCLGMAAGSRASAPLAARSGAVASLLFAVLGIGVAALDLPATSVPSYTNSFAYARWSIAIGAALFTLALPWASRNLRMPGFEALGRESFGIFVFNPLILGIFAWQLGRATTVTESLLRTGATVAIAFPLTRALRKRLPIAFP